MKNLKDTTKEINLSDTQFILHYLVKEKLTIEAYESFCISSHIQIYADVCAQIWDTCAVDIVPYMYVLSKLSAKQFFDLLIFFNHYLAKSELASELVTQYIVAMYDKVHSVDKMDIDTVSMGIEIMKENNVSMLSLLYTMQYFFL